MPTQQMKERLRLRLKEARVRRAEKRGGGKHLSPRLARVVDRNIDTLVEISNNMERQRSRSDRVADAITRFSGSMGFVYLHVVWFAAWIVYNEAAFRRWVSLPAFDPPPFGLLTLVVSLEAIFLATFVLITQNRMSEMAEQRADLDLQIDLLAEYEVTRILVLADAIAEHLGLAAGDDPEIEELKNDVSPEAVLREYQSRKNHSSPAGGAGPAPSAAAPE
jgi:uncharacterized membrane protein